MRKKIVFYRLIFYIVMLYMCSGCTVMNNGKKKRGIFIRGDKWYYDGVVINRGAAAEGLLMNVRMVNAVFEDRSRQALEMEEKFDPETNADAFISLIPEYVAYGVNAFTISLQGGDPGYEGAINSAFNADGTLRKNYLERVERIIRACERQDVVVNLSCFYQRQYSHFSALSGKESIKNAIKNTVKWIAEKRFSNVILEISNEYQHGGYKNWPDGDWLMSEKGQLELIRLAKQYNPGLLVSTSGLGNGELHGSLIEAADFILIHFNITPIDNYPSKIGKLKKYGKPVVCNEDDKKGASGARALKQAVINGCGWGYMNYTTNQSFPFVFKGSSDDIKVYRMFSKATTPGNQFTE